MKKKIGVNLSPTRVSLVSWLPINRYDSTEQGSDCFKRELPVVTTYVLSRRLDQGGVTLTASVLRSATAVKTKVNGEIEIFATVNSQATISL